MSIDTFPADRNVTAVLGPTNTGKTHLAIERMLGHQSGLIGLPLRLLAREVYDKIVAKVGADKVALVTGEEKIKPDGACYWVSTVEAMPREIDVEFLAIDEVQLAGDPERGHVFTDRLLNARGRHETLLLGAQTMSAAIADLVPGANFITRPRLSKLTYTGQKKITRLPRRTAVVAFSAGEVYAIAELMRRQRGGAAVVLGALSPRTRNAQVALYQSGDVDFLVATDAIGMGLNLDVEHVAFSATRKFDGERHRDLTPAELAQIAGRAGRHMNDGTFGVTGTVEPFDADLVERLETHSFEALKKLQWRNSALNFASVDQLLESLRQTPDNVRLMRARSAEDVLALEAVTRDEEVRRMASGAANVEKLWNACQVPDYRNISHQNHAELVSTLFKYLMAPDGRVPEDWFAKQVAFSDRTDGDIDTLSNRIAHIRTWTFVSNRIDWLKDPGHWQGRTRQIEDALSDALHEQLTQRFVDKRTSALMRGLRDKDELFAEIDGDGGVQVEKHYVGRLLGFRFSPEDQGGSLDSKAVRNAASHVLGPELAMRVRRITAAKADAFKLSRSGHIEWRGEEIAKLEVGEDPLKPGLSILCDEHLQAADKEKVQARLDAWMSETITERLKPLVEISKAEDISGLARGIAFQLKEGFGCLRREAVSSEIRSLDQPSRAQLRKYGVRFGAFNIFFPLLLKPAASDLLLVLWTLKNGASHGIELAKMPEPPRAGLTSLAVDPALPADYYRASGFHLCGPRAVRIDILERLADLIRPLLAWRHDAAKPSEAPKGSTGDGGFTAIPDMMSILGCSADELVKVLQALGFRSERREAVQASSEGEPAAEPVAASKVSIPAASGSAAAEAAVPETVPTDVTAPVSPAEPPATADDAAEAAEIAPVEAVAAAPETIEIWRPSRQRRGARPERHNRSRGQGPKPGDGKRPGALAGGEGAAATPVHARAGGSEAGKGERERTAGKDGRGGRRGPDNRGGRDAHGDRDRSAGGQRHGKRFGKLGGGGRGGPDRGARPQTHTAAPAKKRGIDPDSPFASLSQLKAQLEKGTEEKPTK